MNITLFWYNLKVPHLKTVQPASRSPYNFLHPIICHEGTTGYSFTFSLTSELDEGEWLAPRPGVFTSGNDPVPLVLYAGLVSARMRKIIPTKDSIPRRSARSEKHTLPFIFFIFSLDFHFRITAPPELIYLFLFLHSHSMFCLSWHFWLRYIMVCKAQLSPPFRPDVACVYLFILPVRSK
jgi:hypothetical protein